MQKVIYLHCTAKLPITIAYSSGMDKIFRPESEWRALLSSEQFEICRHKGTERAFTGCYWDCKDDGIYTCACCGHPLFDAQHKFDSGTGWPSFTQASTAEALQEESDSSHGMARTEVQCARCDAHLGHVFLDGPAPGGQRYCINSASLKLQSRD